MDWRKEIEKTRRRLAQAHRFHVEEMRLLLVKAKTLLEATKGRVDSLAVTREAISEEPKSPAISFLENNPILGGNADAGGTTVLV